MPPRGRSTPARDGRKLSCKRCQYRKLKCSRTEPCSRCATAGVTCEYAVVDQKRTPASAEYALSLERRVAWLESFIADLRDASPEDRERMLQSASISRRPAGDDNDMTSSANNAATSTASASAATAATAARRHGESLHLDEPILANLELDLDGTLIFHGATSIYRTESSHRQPAAAAAAAVPIPMPSDRVAAESNFDHVMAHFGISLEGGVVVRALMDFFRWQYPHFMFVYRESFLRDHFSDRRSCKYWSAALLMSLCALGTLVSEDEDQRRLSDQFFLAAESIVMVSGLTRPSIPTVQAFLCLAFYEIGRGNLSKGWGFSGIAFRMAQDMGFQRDPKNWMSHDASLASAEDVEIRRRIYWGCFISDKLISLILGRPVHLAHDAAEVDPLKTLPDGPTMEYWRPAGFEDDAATGASNIPYVQEQIRLSRIVESMMATLFSLKANHDGIYRRSNLDRLNVELTKWRESLGDFAKWSRWDSANNTPVPGVISLHLFYHGARIALNYDYAVASRDAAGEASRQYCTASAQDVLALVRTYRMRYGLQYSPLVLVYASVQAIRAINTLGISEEASYLTQALGECSTCWVLARHMQMRLSSSTARTEEHEARPS